MDTIFLYENNLNQYKSEQSLSKFTIKVLLLVIPGIFLGVYTDNLVKYIQYKYNVNNLITFFIQLFLMIITLYSIIRINDRYAYEFQNTISGLFFVSIYFGTQSNFITIIQKLLLNII